MGLMDKIKRKGNEGNSANTANNSEDLDSIYDSVYEESENDDYIYSNEEELSTEDVYADEEKASKMESVYEQYRDDNAEYSDITNEKTLVSKLNGLSASGCNLVVTGCTGSGVTTIAYNLGMILSRLGFLTLIVDFDTAERAQSYVSMDMYKCIGAESMSLERAINNGVPLGNVIGAVKKGLYAIGLGAAVDAYEIDQALKVEKIPEFMASAKSQFKFVIYDVPLDNIVSKTSNIATLADKMLMVMEASSSGVMKIINKITNIEDEALLDMILGKSIPVINKYTDDCSLMGTKVGKSKNVTKTMDGIVTNLAGEDIGIHFSDMGQSIEIPYDKEYDSMWYKRGAYCCSRSGEKVYKTMVDRLV